jgi:hypothetical protein
VFVRDGLIEKIATGDVDISGDYEVIDTEAITRYLERRVLAEPFPFQYLEWFKTTVVTS